MRIREIITAGRFSIIRNERGLKVTKLDTFVAIANALDVSADTLLIDVVAHSVTGVTNELAEKIEKLPIKEQKKIIKVIHTLLEE